MANRDKKKLRGRVLAFIQQNARKVEQGHDPNDRTYDRHIEKLVKRMKPEDLDRLLRDDGQ